MRHLEQIPFAEIAAVPGLSCGVVKMRQMRALDRLSRLVEGKPGAHGP